MSEESEIISQGKKGISMYSSMVLFVKIGKYLTVSSELCVNISYIIIYITVNTVIIIITALIGAEFFIRPPEDFSTTVETYTFHSVIF